MYKKPDYLQKGDQVVIIAPSGRIKEGGLDQAIKTLKNWGLKVIVSEHACDGHHYFSASDQHRLSDLQDAIDSSTYKAIFCARGGYGLTRIIDQVDFSALQKYPKWIVGFSDVTALHLALSLHELQSIHAVMPTGFEQAESTTVRSLQEMLFGEEILIETTNNSFNIAGATEAPITGGNLSLLSSSIGSKYELETDGKILFIEEIDEYLYKIDRMIGQLSRSGKLTKLKGLVVGQMSEMKDTTIPFGATVEELILDHVSQYDYPVLFDVPVGHDPLNLPIVQGGIYQLDVKHTGSALRMSQAIRV